MFRQTPLHQAVIEQTKWNLDVMKQYVDVPDMLGLTPLYYAIILDSWSDVDMLGEIGGTNPNSRDIAGRSPLHYAALFDRYHLLEQLSGYGAEVSARGVDDMQPLHLAAKVGHRDIVQSLAIKGARIDSLDNCQRTPLHWALISCLATPKDSNRTSPAIHFLFNNSANPNLTSGSEWTPLYPAIELGRWEAVKILIERGADINIKHNGATTIHQLSSRESPLEIIILALKTGANVNAKTDSGITPLQISERMNLFENMQTLLRNGADPNAPCRHS
ncbi:ankyrin repeat-containing domain protein [Trichophaea hybrida]|nr:ankyrin repeat-containing domain protein [Trichophaea hybrida]